MRQFGRLWDEAGEWLRGARRIVFIGYSMPATDNQAKRHILEAVRANLEPGLTIHIVLGPNTNEVPIRRLAPFALESERFPARVRKLGVRSREDQL
jgi:hypothetical protein